MSKKKNKETEIESHQIDGNGNGKIRDAVHVDQMYGNWFLDYASYVILERAVPAIKDGLKPVQRRILHSMKEMDDGRFNKVANIIGQTMQYHPHGDAAIGDALVNMGQKDLLIETQGNWGDIRTGDNAAAARYIEARLSKFALEIAFNPQTTEWQRSYDGRKREPINLPMKFPLVLAQGAEGIAVGLSTKIMPHNFNEILDASIDILNKKPVNLLPDFPTGGLADFTNYNEGKRGGKIRVRARIESLDKKTLVIRDIPFGVTTTSLIESIVKANDNNKIKIKKVIDNTAKDIEIKIELPPNTSPDMTIDALYAFTDCEVSISPNACVIIDDKPYFLSVNDILRFSTEYTVHLLKQELIIKQHELAEKWHFSSLEKIFIEKRIYRDIEECETWESVLQTIDKGLIPYKGLFRREITRDDIIRLTEIKIKRISKYNAFKADDAINALEEDMAQVAHDLEHLTDFAIAHFKRLKEKFGRGRERKTEIRSFDSIEIANVAVANVKLYVNRKDGFIGYGLKKDELLCDCSDLDDIIVFLKNGHFLVTRISDKSFVGKDIIHADVWKKNDERMIYNMVYTDGKSGASYIKRFPVTAITRDKPYDLTKRNKGSRVVYFTANPNSESEIITVHLSSKCRARNKVFDFDFSELTVKGRGAQGNILTKYPVQKIVQKEAGKSTLGGMDLWYDDIVGRLNTDERGRYLGNFQGDELILSINKDGSYKLSGFDLNNHYDPQATRIVEQFNPETVVTAVHYDGDKKRYYVKRFKIETSTLDKPYSFISESKGSVLVFVTTVPNPAAEIVYLKGKSKTEIQERVKLNDIVDIKGWKARGNILSNYRVKKVTEYSDTEPEIIISNQDNSENKNPSKPSTDQIELFNKDG